MKLALLALLALIPVSLQAVMVVRDTAGNSVSLQDTPCTAAPWLKEWRTASMFYQGKQYTACWKLQGSMVFVLDSGGDVTAVPAEAFRNETGV